jgi:hypothetical protein
MFHEAKFVRDDVTRFEGEEIIVLRDAKEANKVGKEGEYGQEISALQHGCP